MPLNLPYYYGHSGEQYAFFRIPKLLLTDDRFAEISTDAKLLYGLLLDRMELSYRNGWIDEQNRVFIIFTAEEVMSTLRCRSEKAARLFSELDSAKGIGLIERKRQGLGRPTMSIDHSSPYKSLAGKRTYTVEEIAKILGIGRTAAYSLVHSGVFKAVRIGSSIRVSKVSFDDWLDKQNM